jgi:RNA polymerase sigma-70 factor, ECF subfamily
MAAEQHCGLPAMPASLHPPKPPSADPLAELQYAAIQPVDHLLDLYAQYADTARALASRLLYDRCEAEDVVQDVFLTLWRRPDRFDPARGTGRAWLMTVVRNRSMDHLRRRSLRCHEDVARLFERLPDPHPRDVLEELEGASRNAALWRLVDTLPPSQSALIRRAFVDGKTHQEIADEFGLPLGTVKGRIRLGLEKLRCAVARGMLDGVLSA